MARYLAGRLALMAGTALAILTIVFFLIRLIPGDPVQYMLGDYATPSAIVTLRHTLGLDQSLPVQYAHFVGNALRGNLGESAVTHQPAMQEVMANVPPSVELTVAGILIALAVGIPLGILSSVKRGSTVDLVSMGAAVTGISFPSFWLGLLAILFLAHKVRLFPSFGAGAPGDPVDQLWHLVLPATVLGLSIAAYIARLTRSAMLEVLGFDFIRTAKAKGLTNRMVIWHHALRNALIPVLAVIGVTIATTIGNAILIEIVFSRPGLASLILKAISARDYPLVQASVLVLALAVVLVNAVVDILYGVIDPRVRAA